MPPLTAATAARMAAEEAGASKDAAAIIAGEAAGAAVVAGDAAAGTADFLGADFLLSSKGFPGFASQSRFIET